MAKDKDYIALIHTTQWLNLRREKLTHNPLCERCEAEGFVTPATEVHHHRPVEYGAGYEEKRRLMFDQHNLVSLCHQCHVKEHIELGRSGRAATRRRIEQQVAGVIKKFFGD